MSEWRRRTPADRRCPSPEHTQECPDLRRQVHSGCPGWSGPSRSRLWGNRQGSLSLGALNTLTHTPRLTTHQDAGVPAFDGEGEETVHREGVRGALWEEQRTMGLWRKQSVGNPSWGRGSEGWTQSASSQTHLKLPLHPMCFLGCLKQKGELMVLAVTLLLPNTDVIGKATAWQSCLGGLGSACVSAGGGGGGNLGSNQVSSEVQGSEVQERQLPFLLYPPTEESSPLVHPEIPHSHFLEQGGGAGKAMVVVGRGVRPQAPPSRVTSLGCHESLQGPGAPRKEKTFLPFFLITSTTTTTTIFNVRAGTQDFAYAR